MIKKALHRITVIWCLYGLACIITFIHPQLLWVFAKIGPEFAPSHPEYNIVTASAIMWFTIIIGGLMLFIAGAAIHHFSNWFFNSDTEN